MEPLTPAAVDPPANVLLGHSTADEPAACEQLRHDDDGTARLTVTFADAEPDRPDPTDDTGESLPEATDAEIARTLGR